MTKITTTDFVLKAIEVGKTGKGKGLHTVSSGLQDAFHTYFGDKRNLDKTLKQLVAEGAIVLRECKGGAKVYKPEDAPAPTPAMRSVTLLASMGVTVKARRAAKAAQN